MNINQRFIFTVGLLVVCLHCARQVTESQSTVDDFVTLITYWFQLQVPLNLLGDCYHGIQSTLLNAEPLIELLVLEPSIKDKPGAKDLVISKGVVKFVDVSFSRNGQGLLKHLAFTTPPGGVVAVVGPSGEGKSTSLELILRIWDVISGSIFIDDQDVRDVKLKSLREKVGIVSQVLPL